MCKCQGPHSWIEDMIESQVICYKESFSHCTIEVGEKWYLFLSLFKSLLCLWMHDNHMICLLFVFDLSFKSVHFVMEHDRCKEFIISLVYNYDYKVVLPLFVEETHAF
jgi:hypothetical protein